MQKRLRNDHLRVLSESFLINTNMKGFGSLDDYQISLHPCTVDESSLSFGRARLFSLPPGGAMEALSLPICLGE